MPPKLLQPSPSLRIARIILFTAQIDEMSHFYGKVLGLKQVTNEKGWREFAAGAVTIALHSGPSSPGRKGPKIAFYAEDIAALREALVARGAKFGKVREGEVFCLCDGKDPTEIPSSYPAVKTQPSVSRLFSTTVGTMTARVLIL